MSYKAIIFDLYGTLVGNFSRKMYDKVQVQMAKILSVSYPKFWQTAVTLKDRSLGEFTFAENIEEISNIKK